MALKQDNLTSKFSVWLIVATLLVLIYQLSPILAPFLAAATLAYICNPIVDSIENWSLGKIRFGRTTASSIMTLIVITAMLLLLLIVLPLLQKELMMVAFSLGQLLESMWLTPNLVGCRIGLHPVTVIFSLLTGGQLFGFTGVLLALPASAAVAVALRNLRRHYFDGNLYQ